MVKATLDLHLSIVKATYALPQSIVKQWRLLLLYHYQCLNNGGYYYWSTKFKVFFKFFFTKSSFEPHGENIVIKERTIKRQINRYQGLNKRCYSF